MRNMLLVGSIPYDTPKEVFESFGRHLGTHLEAMPDGEVGPRGLWASRVSAADFWRLRWVRIHSVRNARLGYPFTDTILARSDL